MPTSVDPFRFVDLTGLICENPAPSEKIKEFSDKIKDKNTWVQLYKYMMESDCGNMVCGTLPFGGLAKGIGSAGLKASNKFWGKLFGKGGIAKTGTNIAKLSSGSEIFKNISSLSGKTMREVKVILEKYGFRYSGKTKGGYIKFYGQGAKKTRVEIQIRPNGEIIRYQHSGRRTIRYDSKGNITNQHHSGEFLGGYFNGL